MLEVGGGGRPVSPPRDAERERERGREREREREREKERGWEREVLRDERRKRRWISSIKMRRERMRASQQVTSQGRQQF